MLPVEPDDMEPLLFIALLDEPALLGALALGVGAGAGVVEALGCGARGADWFSAVFERPAQAAVARVAAVMIARVRDLFMTSPMGAWCRLEPQARQYRRGGNQRVSASGTPGYRPGTYLEVGAYLHRNNTGGCLPKRRGNGTTLRFVWSKAAQRTAVDTRHAPPQP